MKVLSLNRIDVTRYRIGDTIFSWLMPRGYTVDYDYNHNRVYLVRSL